jgi:hypothetical protein
MVWRRAREEWRVSRELDSALRRAFSDASIRVRPETKMTDVLHALEALGVSAAVEDGILVLTQGQTEMNPPKALKNFAHREGNENFFILETVDPKTWTNAKRIAYIREHGSEAYGKICREPVLAPAVRVLDPRMSKADYTQLTRQEKINFVREYGEDAVRRIFSYR